ncbi:hypothetical protein A7982_13242 [Minicystis rosea]|nr:hypothetical protein A7982_13242 [Minicystis rosea]
MDAATRTGAARSAGGLSGIVDDHRRGSRGAASAMAQRAEMRRSTALV